MDSPNRRFGDVIARVEKVRHLRGLSKSAFAASVGLKPQTYNNFTGSQGSKPNIELISGLVHQFHVNPYWLLVGTGSIYLEDLPADMQCEPSYSGLDTSSHDGGSGSEFKGEQDLVKDLIAFLETVQRVISRLKSCVAHERQNPPTRADN
jgi:DNA-binding XRE family transcriptional regulator